MRRPRRIYIWEYPDVWLERKRRYRDVRYDLGTFGDLTEEGQERARRFYWSYYDAHLRPRTIDSCSGRTLGRYPVLSEHAEEYGRRLLIHLCDPRYVRPPLPEEEHPDLTEDFARQRASWDRARREARSKFPEYAEDPLGTIPGVEAAVPEEAVR